MKELIKIFGAAVAGALLFTACEKDNAERTASPEDTNALQAYIYEKTADVTIKPAAEGFEITWAEGKFVSAEKKFPVVFGRHIDKESQKAAASFNVNVFSDDDVFGLASTETISFAQGKTNDTLWVYPSITFGEKADLVLVIPEDCQSTYGGNKSVSINVSVDYTWEDRGSVSFADDFWGFDGKVSIQKAKEFKGEGQYAKDSLFRLVEPYYSVFTGDDPGDGTKADEPGDEGSYYAKKGYNFEFLLDENYSAVKPNVEVPESGYTAIPSGTYYAPYGEMWFTWVPENPTLSGFSNENNSYMFYSLASVSAGDFGVFGIYFTWEDGCPEVISVDPSEGDGELKTVEMTKGEWLLPLSGGEPVQVIDLIDPTMAQANIPGSYNVSCLSYINFSDDNGNSLNLEGLVPVDLTTGGLVLAGKYTVGSSEDTAPNTLFSAAFDGTGVNGSVFSVGGGILKHYIKSGTVEIKENEDGTYSVTVDCEAAAGPVKATFTGEIPMKTVNID